MRDFLKAISLIVICNDALDSRRALCLLAISCASRAASRWCVMAGLLSASLNSTVIARREMYEEVLVTKQKHIDNVHATVTSVDSVTCLLHNSESKASLITLPWGDSRPTCYRFVTSSMIPISCIIYNDFELSSFS